MSAPVTILRGTAVPLPRADVDTDQIMPKQFLKRIERAGFGRHIFHDWRASGDFVLDDPAYAGASVLVAGPNFGCGSSREQAVWGLLEHGLVAVVAPSFAPIFRENAARSRLLTVELGAAAVQRLVALVTQDPSTMLEIDIERQQLAVGDETIGFTIDPRTRDGFLLGTDEIGQTLRQDGEIGSHETSRAPWLPTTRAPQVVAVGETMGCFLLPENAQTSQLTFIGAESNVAIGLASLGHSVRWVSRLGDDQVGEHIRRRLRERGVDLQVTRDPVRQTGFAVKELRRDRTTVRYYRRDSAASALSLADVPSLAGAEWLHLTGITPALSASCARLVPELAELATAQGVRVSLDINLRPTLWESLPAAREVLGRLCGAADLVFIGEDESRALGFGDTVAEFEKRVELRPAAVVVFKRGSYGAQALAAGVTYEVAAAPARVVDVTGAGDAFAAGFLSGLLRGLAVPQCLRLGSVMAAQVISVDRDFVDPPGPDELVAILRSVRTPEATKDPR